jgi:transposase
LSDWVKRYDKPASQRKQDDDQAAELRILRAELKRVTQERDILKEVAVYFAGEPKKSTRS